MLRVWATALRIMILILALGSLFLQFVFLPLMAAETVSIFPEAEFLRIPMLVLAITTVFLGQIILGAVWALSGRVGRGKVFQASSIRIVDIMIYAAATISAICLGIFVYLGFVSTVGSGGPGVMLAVIGVLVLAVTASVVLVVLRSLLLQAADMRAELDEVV